MSRLELAVVGLVALRTRVGGLLADGEVAVRATARRLAALYRRWASGIAPNRATFAAMKGHDARSLVLAAEDALTTLRASGIPAAGVLLAVGALAAFAVLASGTGEPLVLTLMAVLSTVGVFALLALAAGHLRVTGRESEGDLAAAAADIIDDGIQIAGSDGSVHYTSRVFREFLGSTASGKPRTIEDVLAGEPAPAQALFRLVRAAERGRSHSETFQLSRPAGEGGGAAAATAWYRLSIRPWHGAIGPATRGKLAVWHLTDVTADRQREGAAARARESLLGFYDQMPVGLVVVDEAGVIEHLNQTLGDWLGLSPASRKRVLRLTDFVAADSAGLLRAIARGEGAAGQPVDVDLTGQNGDTVAARLFLMPRESGSGGFTAGVVKRPAESAGAGNLKTGSARFARLFDAAPFGIALVGRDGRISRANMAFGRLLMVNGKVEGAPAGSLLGKEAVGGLRAPIEEALTAAITQRTAITPVEVTVGESGEFTRRILMSSLGGTGPGADAAVLYVMDATEQKTLEVNFAQSQKMEAVGKLAGGIAHDFNNVLTAIIGFSDLLLQTHRPSDPAYKNIMAIKSSANRAAGMVSQLLAFSRRQTLQPEVLALGETLGDLSVLLKRLLGEKIDLKMHQGRDLWYVKADRSQLSQVIINLAVNARDAMTDGGTLKISTGNLTERESRRIEQPGFVAGEYVVIEVSDTGHGMTPEVMAKIFEPFFTTKGVGKGTGLGLSTVYGIVKQTGGFVFPESGPGKGTTFRVYLPRHHVDSVDEVSHQKVVRKERAADLTGTGCVLLVEDEDAVRGFAVEALKRQGYDVLQAASGAEALEVFAAAPRPIDLVVSDVIMPEMDGPTLLKHLRRDHPALKFVFMSGYPDDAFKNTLDSNTEFAFLQKPFSLMQLATKVKEQIGR